MSIRTRFAPSPTGKLHLGGLRTALYAYTFAKQQKGTFILRIEDTDQNRYVEGAVDNLINTLKNMGIEYQEGPEVGGNYGPYFQSERLDIYNKYIQDLLIKGHAYYCFCSKERLEEVRAEQSKNKQMPKYDGFCKDLSDEEVKAKIEAGKEYVIRLRLPEERTFVFYDKIRGKVEIDVNQIDDQVLIKADGFPTYHFAAVIDDHLMEITHVIRGEEWLPSTPKHVYLYECFGWKAPAWVHLPLILSTEKGKLSKRHGDFSVEAFVEKGYIKDAILNFVALLGWHPSGDNEIFKIEKLIKEFSLKKISKSGAVFDVTKLDWMNGLYLRETPITKLKKMAQPLFEANKYDISDDNKFDKVLCLVKDRITLLNDIIQESKMFYSDLDFSDDEVSILKEDDSKKIFEYFVCKLNSVEFNNDSINDIVKHGMKDLGIKGKKYFLPLRLALYGKTSGADLPVVIDILGKEETIKRLKYADQL